MLDAMDDDDALISASHGPINGDLNVDLDMDENSIDIGSLKKQFDLGGDEDEDAGMVFF